MTGSQLRSIDPCFVHQWLLGFALALVVRAPATAQPDEPQKPIRACRSVHLWWSNQAIETPEATAFYNEAIVDESTGGSYFMACGFSKGYFGIQELVNGKKIALFSVWEPGAQNNPNVTPEERRVKELAHGEGVRVKRFGGEGTGGQSFYDYDWEIGESVRFIVYAKPDGPDRTQYAGYIYLPKEHRWQHMATFSTIANGHLLRGYYSFVEDFRRNGKSATVVHRARFGNGWVLAKAGDNDFTWQPLDQARFTADNTPTMNIDSGAERDWIYLQTGGETKNDATALRDTTALEQAERYPPIDLPKPFSSPTQATASAVRVLSYNIKHGYGNDGVVDLERIAGVIRRLNPDVVALQEVDHTCERSGKIDEAAELAKRTGLIHHAFGSFFDYQGGEYGMAILSRYPIRDSHNLRLPDGAEPRTSLVATIDAPIRFRVADVHFYRTEQERLAQANRLLEYLNANDVELPTVIAGDFNSRPKSAVLELFREWAIPPKGDDNLTIPSDGPRSEIDFLMYRPATSFQTERVEVVHEPIASDHRPVLIDLRLPSVDPVATEVAE